MAYRGALIGFGGVARGAHLPGFLYDARTRERVEIVAAVDPVAATLPIAREVAFPIVADREALAAIGGIDFVDICTPTASHLPLTQWALSQGYHVLCEKPAALTQDDARAIDTAAREAKRTVMPCHQYRFNPAWQQMRAWLAAGVIGPWHLAELSVYRAGADAGAASEQGGGQASWRTTSQGGGILLDHGTHLLYTLLDIAGMPEAVRAWTGRLRHHGYQAEDTAQVALDYDGRLVTLFFTWASHERENRVRFIGERGTIDWIGGTLRLETEGRRESHDFSVQLDKRSYPSWFAALFGTFADAMDAGGTAQAPLADIAQVAHLLDAAFASARTGSRIAL